MSRGIIKHPFKFFFRGILYRLVVGWLILFPLSLLIPKKKKLILFIGRDDGRFTDNTKYLFLYLHRSKPKNTEYCFVTENKEPLTELKRLGFPVVYHPSLKSIYKLLRAGTVIVDCVQWVQKFKYNLALRAKKIQLFHGVFLKKIGKQNPAVKAQRESRLVRLQHAVAGGFPRYHLFLATSEFFAEKIFAEAYDYNDILIDGYPRNDALFSANDAYLLTEREKKLDDKLRALKQSGTKLVLYAPTFRDKGGDALSAGKIDPRALNDFGKRNNLCFLFKFHIAAASAPVMDGNSNFGASKAGEHKNRPSPYKTTKTRIRGRGEPCVRPNIRQNENDPVTGEGLANIVFLDNTGGVGAADIYPFMGLTDLLITDYSSIFVDYLLLDKPIIFFPYDLETFIADDRGLNFDYSPYTPGPKCFSQAELEEQLLKTLVHGEDSFREKRAEIADLAFKYKDGNACQRIWTHIEERFLK